MLNQSFYTNTNGNEFFLMVHRFQISIKTRINRIIAMDNANSMILVSIERQKRELQIHYHIANFATFNEDLQSNQKDISIV